MGGSVSAGALKNTQKIRTQCGCGWAPKNSGCQCTLNFSNLHFCTIFSIIRTLYKSGFSIWICIHYKLMKINDELELNHYFWLLASQGICNRNYLRTANPNMYEHILTFWHLRLLEIVQAVERSHLIHTKQCGDTAWYTMS